MAKVYLETSFVSYLVARRSRDLIVAGRQQLTIDWWEQQRAKFELFISETVLEEAGRGDADEITKRMKVLAGIPLLDVSDEALRLANELLKRGTLPAKAAPKSSWMRCISRWRRFIGWIICSPGTANTSPTDTCGNWLAAISARPVMNRPSSAPRKNWETS